MQPFCYALKAVPQTASPEHAATRLAIAIIFVMAQYLAAGELMARAYVLDQGWTVEAVQAALAPTPAQLARLDIDMQALYRAARRYGIAGIFAAAPRVERDDDSVEVRSLQPPYVSSGSKDKPN